MRSSVVVRSAAAVLVLVAGGQVALAASNGSAHIQAQATMAATMVAIPAACDTTTGLTLYAAIGYDND